MAIFDAVRLILRRGFTQVEVAALDRACDLAELGVAAKRLGSLSERYESGGR